MTISFWLILLAVVAYGLLHSLLASLTTKAHTRKWFGLTTDRWFRIAYNLIAVLTLLPILLLPILLIDKVIYVIHFPWVILTLSHPGAGSHCSDRRSATNRDEVFHRPAPAVAS